MTTNTLKLTYRMRTHEYPNTPVRVTKVQIDLTDTALFWTTAVEVRAEYKLIASDEQEPRVSATYGSGGWQKDALQDRVLQRMGQMLMAAAEMVRMLENVQMSDLNHADLQTALEGACWAARLGSVVAEDLDADAE